MRTLVATLASIALLTLALPVASASPNCLQVYPWSELCQGDVDGFLDAVAPDVCDLKDCVTISPPQVDCIQVYPWSALCQGNVVAFVCYYAHSDSILA